MVVVVGPVVGGDSSQRRRGGAAEDQHETRVQLHAPPPTHTHNRPHTHTHTQPPTHLQAQPAGRGLLHTVSPLIGHQVERARALAPRSWVLLCRRPQLPVGRQQVLCQRVLYAAGQAHELPRLCETKVAAQRWVVVTSIQLSTKSQLETVTPC